MRTFSHRAFYALTFIFFVTLVFYDSEATNSTTPTFKLRGTMMFSFSPNHIIVSSGNDIFRINKDKLTKTELAQFTHTKVSTVIPYDAIDLVWTLPPKQKALDTLSEVSNGLSQEAKIRNGNIEIQGKVLVSSSEDMALIQTRNKIYRLNKSMLANSDLAKVNEIGSIVNLKLKAQALDFSWAYNQKQTASRAPASINPENKEYVHRAGDLVEISGRVLYSYSGPFCLLQAKRVIFQLDCKANKDLNLVGKNLKVKLPASAIQFMWTGEQANRN